MTESEVAAIADQCAIQVVTNAGNLGMGEADLRSRIADFRKLDDEGRFRALVLLSKHKYVASDVIAGEWRFWGRHRAPAGAYCAPI